MLILVNAAPKLPIVTKPPGFQCHLQRAGVDAPVIGVPAPLAPASPSFFFFFFGLCIVAGVTL